MDQFGLYVEDLLATVQQQTHRESKLQHQLQLAHSQQCELQTTNVEYEKRIQNLQHDIKVFLVRK